MSQKGIKTGELNYNLPDALTYVNDERNKFLAEFSLRPNYKNIIEKKFNACQTLNHQSCERSYHTKFSKTVCNCTCHALKEVLEMSEHTHDYFTQDCECETSEDSPQCKDIEGCLMIGCDVCLNRIKDGEKYYMTDILTFCRECAAKQDFKYKV